MLDGIREHALQKAITTIIETGNTALKTKLRNRRSMATINQKPVVQAAEVA